MNIVIILKEVKGHMTLKITLLLPYSTKVYYEIETISEFINVWINTYHMPYAHVSILLLLLLLIN